VALFVEIKVDPALAKDAGASAKLVEACPVDIFRVNGQGLETVDANIDECTLCELCLAVGAPGQVVIRKLYDGTELKRS